MTQRPFSKLKKQIENLFVPELNMEFCCSAYPTRAQFANNHVVRFYVKIGKEIIWDFPKDFPELKEHTFHTWSGLNFISELVRDYIDAPLEGILEKEFQKEKENLSHVGVPDIDYRLTEIFKAADRRIGKKKLREWSDKINSHRVDKILARRMVFNDLIGKKNLSFKERARVGMQLLATQRTFTLEEMREQARRVREGTVGEYYKEKNSNT